MPLKKVKVGSNMYQGWITHTHAHLGGECGHKCSYCYVNSPRFGRDKKFSGPIRLLEDEFKVKYGEGKSIFIDHMNDLFAIEVPSEMILRVINHCKEYPDNTYMFQTKNPIRFSEFINVFPSNLILGSTIETNRIIDGISTAPTPENRYIGMKNIPTGIKKFVTIEPVLDFDVDVLARWVGEIKPDFINLGADSKNHNLPEPTVEKIMAFVEELKKYNIELKEKHNLKRLKPN